MRVTLVLLLISAAAARVFGGETILLQGVAQGTTWHVKFVAPAAEFDAESLRAEIVKVVDEIDREMSSYRPASEQSRLNRAPAREWFAVSRAVAEVVSKSREISEKTGGAQDITVAPLVNLWHFGPKPKRDKAPPPQPSPKGRGSQFTPPTDEEVQRARERVGYKKLDVRMEPPALRKQIDGLEIDLSSIASGYTIDRLADVIGHGGIKNYMVELGGELRAAGEREIGKPWRIAIERPIAGGQEMETAVPLVDAAMATAGGSRHFFEYNGHRYSHVIDPATGRPVEHALSSVTVASERCIDADGWDTPLLVLGPERGLECAEKNGIAAMFIENGEKGDELRSTTAWRKRFGGSPAKP
jgi:thiamine biosynthesis lipoprotein